MLPEKTMLSLWDSFSAMLASQGISSQWLFIGLIGFFLISLLSLREFLCWYLRVYQTQNQIASLQEEISALRKELQTMSLRSLETPEDLSPVDIEEERSDRFLHFN